MLDLRQKISWVQEIGLEHGYGACGGAVQLCSSVFYEAWLTNPVENSKERLGSYLKRCYNIASECRGSYLKKMLDIT